ncbi:MAG: autotransporter outer membrane beta-barrel domain-containing protein, partial [Pseudomonadota bacterium]|nr:autotransporter outer membrane beta-barrel domain-containing protein [Pseudomonadota bacterium]
LASSATVTVSGLTTSGTSDAVFLAAVTTATANVGAGATVLGGLNGILLQSRTGSTVNNEGMINSSASGFAIQANGAAATVNNRGRINGRIDLTDAGDRVNNSGVFAAAGSSLFGAGTDLFDNSGTVLVPGAATFTGLETFNNSGLLDLRDGTVGSRLNLGGATFGGSGGSRLAIDVNFATGTSDLITLGRAEGSTAVIVTPVGGQAVLTPGIRFAQAGAGSSATAFTTANQGEFGLVRLEVAFNAADNSFSLVGTPSGAALRTTSLAEATRSLWHKSAEAWTAEMRASRDLAPDAAGEGQEGGVRLWLQPYGAAHSRGGTGSFRLSGQDRTASLAYDQDYFGGQFGLDFGGGGPAGGLRFGLTGGYLDSHVDFDPATDRLRMKALNAGAYASIASGPFFANLLAKYDRVDIDARSAGAAFELDGDSYGGMLEIGFRADAGGFFIEPTASIAYVDSDLDGFELFGTRLSFDVDESLRGKLGARFGSGFPVRGGARGLLYLGGNYVHEFRAEDRVSLTGGGSAVDLDAGEAEDFGEAFVGISVGGTGPVSGFIEGFGKKGDEVEGGGGRAGLRIRF